MNNIEIIDYTMIKSQPKSGTSNVKTIFIISDMDVNYPSNGLFICPGAKNMYEKIIKYILSD